MATATKPTPTTPRKRAPRSTGPKISSLVAAMEAVFEVVRKNHPDLKKADAPMFLLQSEKRTDKLGHFAPGRWSTIAVNGSKPKQRHEIVVVAEQLKNRKAEDVLDTLLHEAAHALGHVRGVKNTSSNGRYHNARFNELATEVGLTVSFSEQYGWAFTALPPETKKKYRAQITLLNRALKMYRIGDTAKTKTADRNYIKGECNNCGLVLRASATTWENVESMVGEWLCPICLVDDVHGVIEKAQ